MGNPWLLLALPLLADIYLTQFIPWTAWKGIKNGALRTVMSWVDAIVYALVLVYFLFLFVGQNYQIPSSSLEKTLLTGDFLWVNKVVYGPRVPQTPLHFPLAQNTLPLLGCKSYIDNPQLPYHRLKGLRSIESGDIVVRIDNMQQRASGTPLNDKLSDFMEEYGKLQNQIADLPHKESQAIMDGEDENATRQRLNQEYNEIVSNTDQLVTSFIEDNFDNALGPGVFFMMTAGYPHPVLQPWIEALMAKASDNFKNDAYVRDYYSKAKENEAIANGTADPGVALPAEPAKAALPHVPTPAELAAPTEADSLTTNE